jgi:hypothetical protein
VDPSHPRGWAGQAFDAGTDSNLTSTQKFVRGPGNPPAGVGSLRFAIDSNADRVEQFRTADYDGRLLRDLRKATYSTFQRATGSNTTAQQPAYLRLNVDTDGDGAMDEQLYYIPANNGTVQQSAWQTWQPTEGVWNIDGDDGPSNAVSLDDYLAENPDATLVNNGTGALGGAVTFQVGAGGASQQNGEFFLDNIRIGFVDEEAGKTASTTAYDLEPRLPAVSVSDASATEGNGATSTLTFTVSLDQATESDVVVPFHTENGTAGPKDFEAKDGEVTIPAGSTTATVTVTVKPNHTYEPTEAMSLVLGTPDFGTIADGTGTGTIQDNDTLVELTGRNARGHHVRAKVDTTPAADGKPVSIVGGKAGQQVETLFNGKLDDAGELNKVLEDTWQAGTTVRLKAKVFTVEGKYTSKWIKVVVD